MDNLIIFGLYCALNPMILVKKIMSYDFILTAKAIDTGDSDSEPEELVSALPDYDLPLKRERTKLEELKGEEKALKQKPKKEKEKYPEEWEKLKAKQPEEPQRKKSLNMGQGKKLGMLFLKPLRNEISI